MNNEVLKPTIKINNNYKIENEFFRDWMNNRSDISKAIYHLSKAANYLLVWGDIEEKLGLDSNNEHVKQLEFFFNMVSGLQSDITEYIDNNLEVLKLEQFNK